MTIQLSARDVTKAVAPSACLATLASLHSLQAAGDASISAASPTPAPSATPASNSQWGLNDPTTANDIVCYLVTVDATFDASVPLHTISNLDRSVTNSFGGFTGLAAAGGTITLDVPSGPARTISVYGFVALGDSDCVQLPATMSRARFSAPFLLGSVKQDILSANQSVTLDVVWSRIQRFEMSDLMTVTDLPAPKVLSLTVTDPASFSPLYTNSSTPQLSILGDTAASRWCVVEQPYLAAAPNFPELSASCWSSVRPTQVALSSVGPRSVYLFTVDSQMNFAQAMAPATIDYETAAPPTPTLVLRDPLTLSASYLKQLTAKVEIGNDASATSWCLSPTQATAPVSAQSTCAGSAWINTRPLTTSVSAGDGTKSMYIWAADRYGNISGTTTPVSIVLDTTPPVVGLSTTANASTNVSPIVFTLTLSEAVQSVNLVPINGTVKVTGSGLTRTVSVTPTTNGMVGVQAAAGTILDLAGNSNVATVAQTVQFDNIPPVISVSSPVNGASLSAQNFVVSGTCESGLMVSISGASLQTSPVTTSCSGTFSGTVTFTTPDGVKNFNVQQTDAAGNIGLTAVSITRDTTPPALTFANTAIQNPSTSTSTVAFSGACETGLSIAVAGTDSSSTVCSAGAWSYTTAGQATPSAYSYQFTQTDAAGNSTTITGTWNRTPTPPNISATAQAVEEFGQASIPINFSTSYPSPITVNYSFSNATAVSGTDYTTPTATSVTFAAGQTVAYVQVPIRTIDTVGTSRAFSINLNSATVGAITTPMAGVSIADNMAGMTALSGFTQVSAGQHHVCGLKSGAVYCWGSNQYGQLGDGTYNHNFNPTLVPGLGGTITQIAAGGNFTCALSSTSSIYCWGVLTGPSPALVSGVSGSVTSIVAGLVHACALNSTGGVICWGNNSSAQFGNGTTAGAANQMTAVNVSTLSSGVTKIFSGPMASETCALTSANVLNCWGNSFYGLGDSGATTTSTTPIVHAQSGQSVTSMSLGSSHNCVSLADGTTHCWGPNNYSQLGNGLTATSNTPVSSSAFTSVQAISVGASHTCMINTSGAVQCLGAGVQGQLGNGSTANQTSLAAVATLSSGVTQLVSGENFNCALVLSGGSIHCWGLNTFNEVGVGYMGALSLTPINLASLSSPTLLSVGSGHVCSVASGGAVSCWGLGTSGQLGTGASASTLLPAKASAVTATLTQTTSGYSFTCGLTSGGAAQCWGSGASGQLGNGTSTGNTTPQAVTGLTSGVTQISAGAFFACGLLSGGTVECWGANESGQLGNGTTTTSTTPVVVSGVTGATAISAGYSHACALLSSGSVMCWGGNGSGQIGDGTTTARTTPYTVPGLPTLTSLAAGGQHTCALTGSATVMCWGYIGGSVPTPISGFSHAITKITAGNYHSCGVDASGAVLCWGYNLNGQVGNGTSTTSSNTSANVVMSLTSGMAQVVSGPTASETCAVSIQGYTYCWGDNTSGGLGIGRSVVVATPTSVLGR